MSDNELNEKYFSSLQSSLEEISKVMVGQKDLLEKMMLGLLADGHILLEGKVPWSG